MQKIWDSVYKSAFFLPSIWIPTECFYFPDWKWSPDYLPLGPACGREDFVWAPGSSGAFLETGTGWTVRQRNHPTTLLFIGKNTRTFTIDDSPRCMYKQECLSVCLSVCLCLNLWNSSLHWCFSHFLCRFCSTGVYSRLYLLFSITASIVLLYFSNRVRVRKV